MRNALQIENCCALRNPWKKKLEKNTIPNSISFCSLVNHHVPHVYLIFDCSGIPFPDILINHTVNSRYIPCTLYKIVGLKPHQSIGNIRASPRRHGRHRCHGSWLLRGFTSTSGWEICCIRALGDASQLSFVIQHSCGKSYLFNGKNNYFYGHFQHSHVKLPQQHWHICVLWRAANHIDRVGAAALKYAILSSCTQAWHSIS